MRERWRLAGIEQVAAEPSLPFFIEWVPGDAVPGRAPTRHAAGAVRISSWISTATPTTSRLGLGAHGLPIAVRPGAPALALASIVVTEPAGDIILDADPL